jgi:hypothetical protein
VLAREALAIEPGDKTRIGARWAPLAQSMKRTAAASRQQHECLVRVQEGLDPS